MNRMNILAAVFAVFASIGSASAHDASCCTVDFIVRFRSTPPQHSHLLANPPASSPAVDAAFNKLLKTLENQAASPPASDPLYLLRELAAGR